MSCNSFCSSQRSPIACGEVKTREIARPLVAGRGHGRIAGRLDQARVPQSDDDTGRPAGQLLQVRVARIGDIGRGQSAEPLTRFRLAVVDDRGKVAAAAAGIVQDGLPARPRRLCRGDHGRNRQAVRAEEVGSCPRSGPGDRGRCARLHCRCGRTIRCAATRASTGGHWPSLQPLDRPVVALLKVQRPAELEDRLDGRPARLVPRRQRRLTR